MVITFAVVSAFPKVTSIGVGSKSPQGVAVCPCNAIVARTSPLLPPVRVTVTAATTVPSSLTLKVG